MPTPDVTLDDEILNGNSGVTININGEPNGTTASNQDTTSTNSSSVPVPTRRPSNISDSQSAVPDTSALNFPVPTPRETAIVQNELNTPASNVRGQAGVNFIEAFKNSVGDNTTENQSRVMLDFGRNLGILQGRNTNSKTIARSVVNGHHSQSAEIMTAYAAAGMQVPKRVQGLLHDLDNLAAHANAVAEMDDRVRIEAVGRGNKSFDALVIQEQEQALLRELSGLTNDVVGLEDRIKLQQEQVKLEGLVLDNQNKFNDNQYEQFTRIAEGLTLEELNQSINGSNNTGVPRGILQAAQFEKAKAFQDANKVAISNSEAAKQGKLASITDQAFQQLGAQLFEQGQQGALIPAATIQGIGTFTLEEFRNEQVRRAEQQKKINESGLSQAEAVAENNLHVNNITGIAALSDSITNISNQVPVVQNSTKFQEAMERVKQGLRTTSSDTSEAILKDLKADFKDLSQQALNLTNSDDERKNLENVLNVGRVLDVDAGINSLATRSVDAGVNAAAQDARLNGGVWSNVNNVWAALHNQNINDNGIAGLVDLRTDSQKKEATPFTSKQRTFGDIKMRQIAHASYRSSVRELAFVKKSELILADANEVVNSQLDVLGEEGVASALALLDEHRNLMFGSTEAPTQFTNTVDKNLVLPSEMRRSVTDEEGNVEEVVLRNIQTGQAIQERRVNSRYLLDKWFELEQSFKDLGVEYDFTTKFNSGFEAETAQVVVPLIAPRNLHQHELLITTDHNFAQDKLNNPETHLARVVGDIFFQWNNQTNFDATQIEDTKKLLEVADNATSDDPAQKALNRLSTTKKEKIEKLKAGAIRQAITEQGLVNGPNRVGNGKFVLSTNDLEELDARTDELNKLSISELFQQGYISPSALIEAVGEEN